MRCPWCGSSCCANHLRCAVRFAPVSWWRAWLDVWGTLGVAHAIFRRNADYIVRTRQHNLTGAEKLELQQRAWRAALMIATPRAA